jgi:hypothetical protein
VLWKYPVVSVKTGVQGQVFVTRTWAHIFIFLLEPTQESNMGIRLLLDLEQTSHLFVWIGIKIEHQISLLLVFLFELIQQLNIGISLSLDPNPKTEPIKQKIWKKEQVLSVDKHFLFFIF